MSNYIIESAVQFLGESKGSYKEYAQRAEEESNNADEYGSDDAHNAAVEAHLHAAKHAPTIELKQKHILKALDHVS